MKSFFLKFFILFVITMIITGWFKYLLPIEKNYNSAMVDKLELLQKNKHKHKILLIGGSSVGWGLSAEQIQKKTNITTINLGHHAGFGLIDYQEFIISCLTPNDIIIFSPEWVFYEKPDFYDTATLEDLQKNIKYLKITNKSLLVKVKSIYSNDIAFLKNQAKEQSKPYVYNCLNRNGDVISHCLIKPKILIKYHIDFSRFNIKRFRATFKYISKAKCLLIYPPTQKKIYEKYKKSFEKIQIVLSNSNLDYIDLITANVYNEIDFFDAEYHLKCDIKKKRTEKVICEILKIINSSKSN